MMDSHNEKPVKNGDYFGNSPEEAGNQGSFSEAVEKLRSACFRARE